MNGVAIYTATQFRECFSPSEIVFKRELAARFMLNILAPLSPENLFNSAVFVTYTFEPPESEINCENYRYGESARRALKEKYVYIKNEDEKSKRIINSTEYIENYFSSDYVCGCLCDIQDTVCRTLLSEKEKNILFALLSSAYLAAGKTFSDCPVTPKEAENSFRRVSYKRMKITEEAPKYSDEEISVPKENTVPADDAFVTFTQAENTLKCRSVAYKVKQRKPKPLSDGEVIEPRKIIATESALGLRSAVILHIYDSEGKEIIGKSEIRSGDYVFGNFVGDELILLHPTCEETDACIVKRKDNYIECFSKKGRKEKISVKCRDVVALVPENNYCGFVGINTYGAFYDGYSEILFDTVIEKDIVQAQICEKNIYLLHKLGYVYVNMIRDRTTDTRYSDLAEYIKERG